MTYDEVEQFLNTCSKHLPEYYLFFLCAFRTGMRLGELLGLHWGDVDWHGKFIKVQRSFKRGRIDKTKTGKDINRIFSLEADYSNLTKFIDF